MRPWRSWIARQTPTLKAAGSNPVGRTKLCVSEQKERSLYLIGKRSFAVS